MKKININREVVIVSLLLFILARPMFGPVPQYLLETLKLSVRETSGWLLVGFLIPLIIIVLVVVCFVRNDENIELGFNNKSPWRPLVVGAIIGVFWGLMGWGGMKEIGPHASILEVSLFRFYMMVFGALGAVLEDVIIRSYVMNKLKQLNMSTIYQVLFSGLLFALYHTAWNFNYGAFIFSIIYGLMLSGLFVWGKRSLAPVILAHSLALIVGEPCLTIMMVLSV